MIIIGLIIFGLVLIELVLLQRLLAQRPAYKKYWNNRAQAEIPANATMYVALGDSTAQGIGASKPEKGYVGLLAEALAQKTRRPVHVINLSRSGAKIQDVLERQLPELQKLMLPVDAVITLNIGSNNIGGYNAQEFEAGMEQIVKQMPPQTVVGDIPYFGGGRGNGGERNASDASVIIANLAKKYNLRLAQLHQATRLGHGVRDFAADFFHPSDRAYQKWFKAFWEVLQ